MALNIGNINFTVDANTAGLQKAVKQLEAFQRETNKVARAQNKGATAAANAMARQEQAIRRAFQQTLNLQRQLSQSGAPQEEIEKVTRAFQQLTKELTRGNVSTVEFTRSVDAFQARMGRIKRSFADLRAEAAGSGKSVDRFAVIMRDLESSAVLALGPLSAVGARIRSLSAIFGRSSLSLALWISGIAGAVIATVGLGRAMVRSGSEFKAFQLRLESATGSIEGGRRELKFTIDLAKRLGLDIGTLTKSYTRFLAASQGTNLEGHATRRIFTQVARAAAALKLDAASTEGVMRALEQIMSKGNVQAEELRNQLGDRLPGAFRIAAEAMGVSTQELNRMLKAGEIVAEEFLPLFGKAVEENLGRNAEKNLKTLSGATQNLSNTWSLLMNDFDRSVNLSGKVAAGINITTAVLESLAGAVNLGAEGTDAFGDAASDAADKSDKLAQKARQLTNVFSDMNEQFADSDKELRIVEEALAFFGRVPGDIDFLLKFFEELEKSTKANQDELDEMAEIFEKLFGFKIPAEAEGIAAAFAEMAKRIEDANKQVQFLRNAPEALEEVNQVLQEARDRFDAFSKGPAEGEFFDDITTSVRTFREQVEQTTLSQEAQNVKVAEYRALLISLKALQDSYKQTQKDSNAELRQSEALQRRQNNAITDAVLKIGELRENVRAMGQGPDSLEVFDKITQPLMRFQEQMVKLNMDQKVQNALTGEYRRLLEEVFKLTDRFSRASEQLSNAMLNGIEDLIARSKTLKDVLRDLAEELLRLLLRTFVLDKIQAGLTQFFRGTVFGGGGPVPGTGGGAGTTPPTFATGGSFKLRGSGGSDKVPFFGIGKAGETVSVSRPDQMNGGGGGTYITINAPGADAGTIQRIEEIVRVKFVPQIMQAATANTVNRLNRPKFA